MNIVRNSLVAPPTPTSPLYFFLKSITSVNFYGVLKKLQTIDNSLMAVGKKRRRRRRENRELPRERESLLFSSSKLFKYASAFLQPHRHYFTLLRAMANAKHPFNKVKLMPFSFF